MQTIIFDFDGVLANTGADIANAANFVLRQMKLKELPPETIAGFIGGGAEPLMRRCLAGQQAEELLEPALQMFKARYATHYFQDTTCYPGVSSLLEQLHTAHKNMAIATNKVEQLTRGILTGLHIDHYFQAVVGPDSVTHRKPHPEALQRILTHLNTAPSAAIMIGDTAADILAGKAAGTVTCGVTYGYGSRKEIEEARPDFIIDEITSLIGIIENL